MARYRKRSTAGLVGLALVLGCGSSFKLSRFSTTSSLFEAGVRELRAGRCDHAVQVYEKLTAELPVRDTLLPSSHFHLAEAHACRGEHLLAAQEYVRLSESFATDSLADKAQYRAGREYQLMWRKPTLDPTYGSEAVAAYQGLLALYPDSPLRDSATTQLAILEEMYAAKDYENGMYYFRRKAYDPAIIYFRGVVDRYPRTQRVREAFLRLAQIYERIRYSDDKTEVCTALHARYPRDREVTEVCGPVPQRVTPARSDTL
jgi:outer membrane protein assembly factor BamD